MAECSDWSFSGEYPMATTDEYAMATAVDIEQLHFLMQGYLHITEEKTDHTPFGIYLSPSNGTPGKAAHMSLVKRTSDSSIKGSWKHRWCVLSRTPDGVHLVYYKHQSSYANCEPPVGVVFMESSQSLYTIPSHSKSKNIFSVSFPNRNILLYPDKESELEKWLEAFQTALNLHDASMHSPLKGLPKAKANRKDSVSLRPHEQGMMYSNQGHSKRATNEVPLDSPDLGGPIVDSTVKVVSYRPLSDDEVATNTLKRASLARSDSIPHTRDRCDSRPVVLELDSEESSIQIVGFKTLL